MSELRKVQRTPSGTFFVRLPNSWAERYGLKRGSIVSLSETDGGKLVIHSKYGVESSLRTVILRPELHLGREITENYLVGFDIMHVEAKDRIDFDVRSTIKNTVSRLVGLEIVEESSSVIVLQCLLEPSGFPPEKILRRGYAIVAGCTVMLSKLSWKVTFSWPKTLWLATMKATGSTFLSGFCEQ